MKGQINVADALGLLVIAAAFVLILAKIPQIFHDFFTLLALSFSEVVSRDLAGMISISAAAPNEIEIEYRAMVKEFNYTVELRERTINVTMLRDSEAWAPPSLQTYPVDGLNKKIENKRDFKVRKWRIGLDNYFDFEAIE